MAGDNKNQIPAFYKDSPACLRLLNTVEYLKIPVSFDDFFKILDFLQAPAHLEHFFYVLQELPEILGSAEKSCAGPRWRWLQTELKELQSVSTTFSAQMKSVSQNLFDNVYAWFTKNPGTTRNYSLGNTSSSAPLYATMGHRPMDPGNNSAYHHLQAQLLIACLVNRYHGREKQGISDPEALRIEALRVVRSLANDKNQLELSHFPQKTLTPERYLAAIRALPKDSVCHRLVPFLEQAIKLNRQQSRSIAQPERLRHAGERHVKITDFFTYEQRSRQDFNPYRYLVESPDRWDAVSPGYDILSSPERLVDDLEANYSRLSRISKHFAKENQVLQHAWSELSLVQATGLIRAITSRTTDPEAILANACLHLMFWAGAGAASVLKILRGPTSPAATDAPAYFPAEGKLRLSSPGPPLSRPSQDYASSFRLPKQDQVELVLPDCARVGINRVLKGQGLPLPLEAADLNALCYRRLAQLRRSKGLKHLSLGKIKNFHFRYLSRMSNSDLASAALILGRTDFLARTRIHYACFDAHALSDTFSRSCRELLQIAGMDLAIESTDPFDETLHVGSPFRLRKERIRSIVDTLLAEIQHHSPPVADDPDRLVRYHNLYTIYTALLICYATGHRRSGTPFLCRDEWDPVSGFGCIRDKDTSDYYHSRLVWIPEVCRMQLAYYAQHLKALQGGCRLTNETQQDIAAWPEFFLINANQVETDYGAFARELARFGYDVTGHPHRHVLKSELQENGCDPEILEAFLGHWQTGQEPMVRTSSLHPQDFRCELSRYLPQLLTELGFRPIAGLGPAWQSGVALSLRQKKPRRHAPRLPPAQPQTCLPATVPAQVWFMVAAGVRRHAAHANWPAAFSPQQLAVLSGLHRDLPELYRGEPHCRIDACILEGFIARLVPQGLAPQKKFKRLLFLSRGLRSGAKQLGWQSPYPQVPYVARREKNRIRPSAFRRLGRFRQLEALLLADLEKSPPRNRLCRVGQILLSAILYGGLLHQRWINRLPSALNDRIYQQGDWMWLDLESDSAPRKQQSPEQRYIRQSSPAAFRRWFPDPLSQLLIYRWLEAADDYGKIGKMTAWQALSTYLSSLKADSPQSLAGLVCLARPAYSLTLPSFLCAYAEDDLPSASLPDPVWLRNLTGEILPIALRRKAREGTHALRPLKKIMLPCQTGYLKELKAIFETKNLRGVADKRKKVIVGLDHFLASHPNELAPILQLLAHWARQLLSERCSPLEHRQKKPLATSSVQAYIEMIGPELLATCNELSPLDFHLTDYEAFYHQVCQKARVAAEGKAEPLSLSFVGRLDQFHRFLVVFYGEPEVAVHDIAARANEAGFHPSVGAISANLISEQYYRQMRDRLGFANSNRTRAETMRLVAFVLAYRTGLRRSELHGLTLEDVQSEKQADVLELCVVANDHRQLKSRSATRRLPLQLVLEPDERALVENWLEQRQHESGQQSGPVFSASQVSSELVSDFELFGASRLMIKQTLEDQQLVWHHLRDSFLHSFYLRLMVRDDIPMRSRPGFLEGEIFANNSREHLRRGLFGKDRSNRKVLFAGATLIGHADMNEGFRSYFHMSDWLLGYHLRHPQHLPKISPAALTALTGLGQARVYALRSSNDGMLYEAIQSRSKKFAAQLAHPLLPRPSQSGRAQQGRKASQKAMPEFDVVYAAVARKHNDKSMTTDNELRALKSIYKRFSFLGKVRQRKVHEVVSVMVDCYVQHGNYFQFQTPLILSGVLKSMSDLGIYVDLSSMVYHPSRYSISRSSVKKTWDRAAGVKLTVGKKCQIRGKADCIRLGEAVFLKNQTLQTHIGSIRIVMFTCLLLQTLCLDK